MISLSECMCFCVELISNWNCVRDYLFRSQALGVYISKILGTKSCLFNCFGPLDIITFGVFFLLGNIIYFLGEE